MKFLDDRIYNALKKGKEVKLKLSKDEFPILVIEGEKKGYKLVWEIFEIPLENIRRVKL